MKGNDMVKTYVERREVTTYKAFEWDGASYSSDWPDWFKKALDTGKVKIVAYSDGPKICYHTQAKSDKPSGNPRRVSVGCFVMLSKAFVCGFRVLPAEQFHDWYEESK